MRAARQRLDLAARFELGKLEGDNIVASLNYANGQVDFNGQVMPVEQFAGMLAITVSAGLDPKIWGTLPTFFTGAVFSLGLILVIVLILVLMGRI